MKRIKNLEFWSIVIMMLVLFSSIATAEFAAVDKEQYPYAPSLIQWEKSAAEFTDPETCGECHPQQYDEWRGSMHSLAFQDPIYQGELVLAIEAVGHDVARQCEGCHSAAAVVTGEVKGAGLTGLSPLAMAGVSCDICHSIKGHTHWQTPTHQPENGSMVLSPGKEVDGEAVLTKFGPLPAEDGCGDGFHECVESPLHQQTELCGSCHQITHYEKHTPLEMTYSEWKNSTYAAKGINCQDCHMVELETFKRSADTFQKPVRGEYHHYFNGANFLLYALTEMAAKKSGDEELAASSRQKYEMAVGRLQAAATLDVSPVYRDGKLAEVVVRINNERAGHYLPTSLTNIRQMWLEVTASDASGKTIMSSGQVDSKGKLPAEARRFNSDGMGDNMHFAIDPWSIVSFSKHDTIPPKGYREAHYGLTGNGNDPITVNVKLRFRQANQKVAEKLLSHVPDDMHLDVIYGIKEVPPVPIIDMVDKTITINPEG
ncbi:multiheme c-type cytochrome [uncultured Desulfuromusa sp.]|uniref:multiheme c-type cytochrome n=1 Tax=uncultured Desulfuromusa sp. TaxID=219183 RepID=UPI002AA8EBD5|nr:multiheme c-type cytochrome [uncultured Desulfuromusa sp.]